MFCKGTNVKKEFEENTHTYHNKGLPKGYPRRIGISHHKHQFIYINKEDNMRKGYIRNVSNTSGKYKGDNCVIGK